MEKSERLELRAEKRVGVVVSGRKCQRAKLIPHRLAERTLSFAVIDSVILADKYPSLAFGKVGTQMTDVSLPIFPVEV
jgi:hypothetical protein